MCVRFFFLFIHKTLSYNSNNAIGNKYLEEFSTLTIYNFDYIVIRRGKYKVKDILERVSSDTNVTKRSDKVSSLPCY